MMNRDSIDIVELLKTDEVIKICAPMVRYSKLQFRSLVRNYGCQLCYTPMIMADSFLQSPQARESEFSTNEGDSPLVVQFASKNVDEFVSAAQLVSPFSDGVDLNCGCPQGWAMKKGIGADLLNRPHLVQDMVRQLRNRTRSNFSVSIKIRIKENLRKTIELCQMAQAAGVSFIAVHGRTVKQRNEPVNTSAIKEIKQSLRIPVIANGSIKSVKDVNSVHEETGCDGVMVGGGLLSNPACLAGAERTPLECVSWWLERAPPPHTPFSVFHHHLVFMTEHLLNRPTRAVFNTLTSPSDIVTFLSSALSLPPLLPCPLPTTDLLYPPVSLPLHLYSLKNDYNGMHRDDILESLSSIFYEE